MAESTGESLLEMSQETALAQEALRDERAQGHPDTPADRLHEEKDSNLRVIAWTTAGMGALGMGMFVGLWLLLGLFTRTPAAPDAPISPLALNLPPPPAPHIEDATPQNYRLFLRSEEQMLHTAGPLPPTIPVPDARPGSTPAAPPLTNPGPGVIGPNGAQAPVGTAHISIEQAEETLLRQGFDTRPQNETPAFAPPAPEGGVGMTEPPGKQSPGTYRADVGPKGTNP